MPTSKTKILATFAAVGIPILTWIGIPHFPTLAFAEDLTKMTETVEQAVKELKKRDEELELRDLQLRLDQQFIVQDQYESRLSETEDLILQYEAKDEKVPSHLNRRIQRYERFLDQSNTVINNLNGRIQEQEAQIDLMF